ncbi:MAG: DUF4173 domain-containing protein [Clostridiales bacterium]|nr:DUF4173 domain-containing protein [Clostridiales bacterium]
MEQNPMQNNAPESAARHPAPTKPQLWLLGGALVIGVACELWMELDHYYWYSIFWLATLGVFAAFNWKRMLANKTVLALILPTLVLIGILMFDYMNVELVGFTSLAIPALLITIGVFTTQQIAYKREGKAVLGVLRAVFVKPFTAIGAYFRAVAGIFRGGERSSTRHGWIGLAVGLPLMAVVLALLAGADEGTAKLLGGLFENIELWQWVSRVVVVFVSSMLFYSLFFNLTWEKADEDRMPVRQNWKTAGPGVVIGLLLAAYALFTYVQFTYLFGGVLPVDLTYSEYAREGFGQFLAVTLINFAVLGVSLAKSEPGRVIKALQTLLIAASLIVLASAAWRLLLYVGAYGLTIRRVLPLWLMAYFAFLAVIGAVRVYREQVPFLRIGAFALVYWYAAFICIDWNTLMYSFNIAHGFGG